MPGITGFIVPRVDDQHPAMLGRMVESMMHETFYRSGSAVDRELGICAGWVCHKGTYADCHPIWNESGSVGLYFAGEHFADPAQNGRLRAAGHEFPDDDARALVHLYEERGTDFFRELNGTFSGILVDKREKKVVLFNDRFGLGRIYVHEGAEGFYFSSEAKAILRAKPQLGRIDARGLGELMVCGCVMENRTVFPAVSLLPPASMWTFQPGLPPRKESYFDHSAWETQTSLPPAEYYESLKATFNRIQGKYFAGSQPVALSVTGGLDSRMIIAGLNPAEGTLPCYTFGGMFRDSADVKIGRQIAALCKQPYSTITIDSAFFPQFQGLAQRCVTITDGTMDVSGAVGIYANRLARQIAPVRMTGNYGSEILRRHVAFRPHQLDRSLFSADFVPLLSRAVETYRSERSPLSTLSFIVRKQLPYHHYARFSEEQSQLTIRAPYLENELVALAFRAPDNSMLNKQLAHQYIAEMMPELSRVPTDRGMYPPPRFVPARLYALANELVPRAEYQFDYGMPHWLAAITSRLSPINLDRFFLGHQKYYHFRRWYSRELASSVREILLDSRSLSRPHLSAPGTQKALERHLAGSGNFTTEIHKLLTVEFIYRAFIDG